MATNNALNNQSAPFTVTAGDMTVVAGRVAIPSTTSTIGYITMNGDRYIHSFGGISNTFLGTNAGNFTLSGISNNGFGLNSLTSLTTGNINTGFGQASLHDCTSGGSNTAFGASSMAALTTGQFNAANGILSLGQLLTGSSNVAIGYHSGLSYTSSESSNVLINNVGTVGDNHVMRLGTTGSGQIGVLETYIAGVDGVNVGSVAKVMTMGSTGERVGTATLTAGTNISVVPTANTITINSTGAASFSYTEVTGTSSGMLVNTGYIANNAGVVTLTLPSTAALGSIIEVVGKGAGGWLVAQNSGQTIHFNATNTTTGVGGSLASTVRYNCLRLVCTTADTDFVVTSSEGNITIV